MNRFGVPSMRFALNYLMEILILSMKERNGGVFFDKNVNWINIFTQKADITGVVGSPHLLFDSEKFFQKGSDQRYV